MTPEEITEVAVAVAKILNAKQEELAKVSDAELISQAKVELSTNSAIKALENRKVERLMNRISSQELAYEAIESAKIPATEKLRARKELRWL
jgi:hypothetical protein